MKTLLLFIIAYFFISATITAQTEDNIQHNYDLAEALKLPVNEHIQFNTDGKVIDWTIDSVKFEAMNQNIEMLVGKEKFNGFLYNFAVNPYFQRSRIHFPLKEIIIVDTLQARKSFEITKTNFNNTVMNDIVGLYMKTSIQIPEYSMKHNQIVFSSISKEKINDLYFIRNGPHWILAGKVVRYFDYASLDKVDDSFENFFVKFVSDFDFQKARIRFPYYSYIHNIEIESVDTLEIQDKDYKTSLFTDDQYFIIYNNFEKELRKSDKIFMRFEFNDYGQNQGFNFQKIDGKWFLTDGLDTRN